MNYFGSDEYKQDEIFVRKVLKKVRDGKLDINTATVSMASLLNSVNHAAEDRATSEYALAFGNDLLDFSMRYFLMNEPATTRLFRDFLIVQSQEQRDEHNTSDLDAKHSQASLPNPAELKGGSL